MISNIDKTESERLNQKLRDIVTGKYQSPAKQRNNFFKMCIRDRYSCVCGSMERKKR